MNSFEKAYLKILKESEEETEQSKLNKKCKKCEKDNESLNCGPLDDDTSKTVQVENDEDSSDEESLNDFDESDETDETDETEDMSCEGVEDEYGDGLSSLYSDDDDRENYDTTDAVSPNEWLVDGVCVKCNDPECDGSCKCPKCGSSNCMGDCDGEKLTESVKRIINKKHIVK